MIYAAGTKVVFPRVAICNTAYSKNVVIGKRCEIADAAGGLGTLLTVSWKP